MQYDSGICYFCGEFEDCTIKNHTRKKIDSILYSSGLKYQIDKIDWWNTAASGEFDVDSILFGYTPEYVWDTGHGDIEAGITKGNSLMNRVACWARLTLKTKGI